MPDTNIHFTSLTSQIVSRAPYISAVAAETFHSRPKVCGEVSAEHVRTTSEPVITSQWVISPSLNSGMKHSTGSWRPHVVLFLSSKIDNSNKLLCDNQIDSRCYLWFLHPVILFLGHVTTPLSHITDYSYEICTCSPWHSSPLLK